MKFLLKFLILCYFIFCLFPTTKVFAENITYVEKDASTSDIKYLTIWVAVPIDYPGDIQVYLHSNADASGTNYGRCELVYQNSEWKLYKNQLGQLKEDTYWVTMSTNASGGLLPEYTGISRPDLEKKSVIPETDREVISLFLEKDPVREEDTSYSISEGAYYSCHGYPQFFCIYGKIADMESYHQNFDHIFANLLKEYALEIQDKYYDEESIVRRLTPHSRIDGHLSDYLGIYSHLGYTVEEYAEWSYNKVLQSIYEESTITKYITPGQLLSKVCQDHPEYAFSDTLWMEDPAAILRSWGWEIYYDVSDPSVLSYENESGYGYNTGDFYFHTEEKSNMKIPVIDGTQIPKGSTFPFIGTYPTDISLPDIDEYPELSRVYIPEEIKPMISPKPEAEVIETFPTPTPTLTPTPVPTVIPTPPPVKEAPSFADYTLPIILCVVLFGLVIGGVVFLLKKRKY